MGRHEKRLEAMRNKQSGWRFSDVKSILEAEGFVLRRGSGGSHRVFKHPSGARVLIVDHGSGELPGPYVREAIDAIDRAGGGQS